VHKSTRAQEHKSTRAQEHKSTSAQEHKAKVKKAGTEMDFVVGSQALSAWPWWMLRAECWILVSSE